jgi:hypothetical protein
MQHIIHVLTAASPGRWALQNIWTRPARAGHATPKDLDREIGRDVRIALDGLVTRRQVGDADDGTEDDGSMGDGGHDDCSGQWAG